MNCENKREEEERKEERKESADRLISEPYTCERLSYTRGGYKDLTGSCAALQFDFTDPQVYTCTGSSFVLGNVTALGVLCCFHCCLFDLACFFLPSFSCLIKTLILYTYMTPAQLMRSGID